MGSEPLVPVREQIKRQNRGLLLVVGAITLVFVLFGLLFIAMMLAPP
jgi:hypothetical protein